MLNLGEMGQLDNETRSKSSREAQRGRKVWGFFLSVSGWAVGRSGVVVLASKTLSPLPSLNWKPVRSPSAASELPHGQYGFGDK